MILQPVQAFGLVDLGQAAAHRVLADDLAHPKQRRVNRVAAQRGHMRIPTMAGQHRQHHRAEQVSRLRCVRAGERQQAIGDPGVEQSGLLQVIDEEWQLPKWRDRCCCIPLDVDPAREGVRCRRVNFNRGLFTRRVSQNRICSCPHPRRFQRFGQHRQSANCRIWGYIWINFTQSCILSHDYICSRYYRLCFNLGASWPWLASNVDRQHQTG